MRTIKLVIIGDSGVGKTSLRSNYVSGRFSSGYRATIGTDFISKSLPHHSNPGEVVTLQIWDTAGQERFSSISTAFFRGADAVLMVYDVNRPTSLQGLRKWWKEFQLCAPVPEEDAFDYCCVVVGNKIDLAENSNEGLKMSVTEGEAHALMEELIPKSSDHSPDQTVPADQDPIAEQIHEHTTPSSREETSHIPNGNGGILHPDEEGDPSTDQPPKPINIRHSGDANGSTRQSMSRIASRVRLNGTMTSTRTGVSIYHTPSSSLFDEFVSAPSSPLHSNASTLTPRRLHQGVPPPSPSHRKSGDLSISSSSTTIKPTTTTLLSQTPPPHLDHGPKLFLASAKSGYAVTSIFEYVAKRVVTRLEWEERAQVRTLDAIERPGESAAVQLAQSKRDVGWTGTCCS